MLNNIESILSEGCKLVPGRPVIVGVSGGADSLCLLGVMRQAGYSIIVAHFNHKLRPEADGDARAVEQIASQMDLVSRTGESDVRAFALEEGLSIEEAARNLRYHFLFSLAHEYEAQAVAVGHTADDQVETVLMHFLRGSGLSGLKGMSFRTILKKFDPHIPLVRPLLQVWRHETTAYCTAQGWHPNYDSSNDSLEFKRNQIRHLLIPELESYNPRFRESLLRMSDAIEFDYKILKEIVDKAWLDAVVDLSPEVVTFDSSSLSGGSIGLQRNLIRRAVQILQPEADVNFAAIERACKSINSGGLPARVDLKSGLYMAREGDRTYVCTSNANLPITLWPQLTRADTLPVTVPVEMELEGQWRFSSQRLPADSFEGNRVEQNADRFQAWLDADTLPESLELRVRQPGDRFQPLGLDGHTQKISDFMVNEKMPQRARDRWPLLCSGEMVIWVPGYRPAYSYRLTESTRHIVHFSLAFLKDK